MQPKITDEEFLAAREEGKTYREIAEEFGMNIRSVERRGVRLARQGHLHGNAHVAKHIPDGFGPLPDCKIAIMRGHTTRPDLVEALVRHISESLDNISVPAIEETGSFDFAALSLSRMKRHKPNHVLPGW